MYKKRLKYLLAGIGTIAVTATAITVPLVLNHSHGSEVNSNTEYEIENRDEVKNLLFDEDAADSINWVLGTQTTSEKLRIFSDESKITYILEEEDSTGIVKRVTICIDIKTGTVLSALYEDFNMNETINLVMTKDENGKILKAYLEVTNDSGITLISIPQEDIDSLNNIKITDLELKIFKANAMEHFYLVKESENSENSIIEVAKDAIQNIKLAPDEDAVNKAVTDGKDAIDKISQGSPIIGDITIEKMQIIPTFTGVDGAGIAILPIAPIDTTIKFDGKTTGLSIGDDVKVIVTANDGYTVNGSATIEFVYQVVGLEMSDQQKADADAKLITDIRVNEEIKKNEPFDTTVSAALYNMPTSITFTEVNGSKVVVTITKDKVIEHSGEIDYSFTAIVTNGNAKTLVSSMQGKLDGFQTSLSDVAKKAYAQDILNKVTNLNLTTAASINPSTVTASNMPDEIKEKFDDVQGESPLISTEAHGDGTVTIRVKYTYGTEVATKDYIFTGFKSNAEISKEEAQIKIDAEVNSPTTIATIKLGTIGATLDKLNFEISKTPTDLISKIVVVSSKDENTINVTVLISSSIIGTVPKEVTIEVTKFVGSPIAIVPEEGTEEGTSQFKSVAPPSGYTITFHNGTSTGEIITSATDFIPTVDKKVVITYKEDAYHKPLPNSEITIPDSAIKPIIKEVEFDVSSEVVLTHGVKPGTTIATWTVPDGLTVEAKFWNKLISPGEEFEVTIPGIIIFKVTAKENHTVKPGQTYQMVLVLPKDVSPTA